MNGSSDLKSVEETLESYIDDLKSYRASVSEDPQLNPTAQVAFRLSRAIEAGETSVAKLGQLAKSLGSRAFIRRAEHLSGYVGPNDEDGLNARLNALVDAAATNDGKPGSFERFKAFWEHARTGAVFTAHPTFGISRVMREIMVEIATARDDEARRHATDRLSEHEHAPDPGITLQDEHDQAQAAIAQLQDALVWLGDQILQRAALIWPDKWKNLDIRPLSVASWVGYDLDGRTDIGWQQMVRLRLEEKAAQLRRYQGVAQSLQEAINDAEPAYGSISAICSAITEAVVRTEESVEMFSGPVEDPNTLADAANALTDTKKPGHVTSVESFVSMIDEAITYVTDNAIARRLIVLRSEMKNIGLGTAHLHFRINATQLHNGFTRLLQLGDENVTPSRIQLSRLDDLIARAEPRKVNFRSLMHEGTTAIRQFILIAQILKHIDSETPIRFLIAECESAYSVLIALYFARLFGVEHRIDISPLFETPSALEKGVRILEQLLDNERYHAYAHLRGRIAIQTGFSDAGRFLGQIPACLAIERLQMKLARMLGNRGTDGIEVLFFNTHGESMGRGAHPISMSDRFDYVLTPAVRRQFSRAGIPLKHETSFQGGDGYLLFTNAALARASLCSILENAQTIPVGDDAPDIEDMADDLFYRHTDFSLDFFLHLKRYQEALFEDDDYRVALGCFGTNLLFKTGSRRSLRQHEITNAVDRGNPRQMRAIPHNAILQQLGFVPHIVSGVGVAVGDERDGFVELCLHSDRVKRFMDMVAYAKRLSSLNTLSAYARLFDPGYWVSRAYSGVEEERAPSLRRLGRLLNTDPRHEAIMRLVHHLREDAIDLHGMLDQLSLKSGKMPDDSRLELDLLHAIRIALMEHIFMLAAQIPAFAPRHDIAPDQVMALVLSMDVPEAVSLLKEVFPADGVVSASASFNEEANYMPGETSGYLNLHQHLIKPMAESYEVLRRISVAVSHHFRAHG